MRIEKPTRRWLVSGLGLVMVWGAIGLASYAIGWDTHKDAAAKRLISAENKTIDAHHHHKGGTCVVTGKAPGSLTGLLTIPSLKLVAPVEQGTTDVELDAAVGHDPESVWPGKRGTSVLLAHDVSYFDHVGTLHPGDKMVYTTACGTGNFEVTGSSVVHAGTPVPGSTTSTIVLDTCYPPNALYFTTTRLLVRATLKSPTVVRRHHVHAVRYKPKNSVAYHSAAPPALTAQGLTLEDNEVPMGVLTSTGEGTHAFEQSPGPLQVQAAALADYFGGIKTAEQMEPTWWRALALRTALPPSPLLGATGDAPASPLDVEIVSSNKKVSGVTLTTTVGISGGEAPGIYRETVTLVVQGATVRIANWQMVPT